MTFIERNSRTYNPKSHSHTKTTMEPIEEWELKKKKSQISIQPIQKCKWTQWRSKKYICFKALNSILKWKTDSKTALSRTVNGEVAIVIKSMWQFFLVWKLLFISVIFISIFVVAGGFIALTSISTKETANF